MSRIRATFERLRAEGRVALIPFFTAGDPDLDVTRDLVLAAVAEGADLIELGVPFSDPMADGPVLQRAAIRALAAGTTLPRILGLVAELRRTTQVPIILFGYYNPFFRYGAEALARDAARAGADGFLCVDLPPEEAGDLHAASTANDLDLIYLFAPTTPPERLATIARSATGFLYLVSVLGVTGARDALPPELPDLVARARPVTGLPIGVGFGVQRPEQAAWVAGFADAVIVGSAFSKIMEASPRAEVVERVRLLVRSLREATRKPG
jgi:tryptophan synthase alpha chain